MFNHSAESGNLFSAAPEYLSEEARKLAKELAETKNRVEQLTKDKAKLVSETEKLAQFLKALEKHAFQKIKQ